jgi:hypothetical protein
MSTFDGKDTWAVVRELLAQRDMLNTAMRAILADDQSYMQIFAQDYGMQTDLDPIRKTDIIKHAVARIDQWR